MHIWSNFKPVFQKSPPLPAPTSLYRVQLTPAFTFDDLVAILPLLAARGIAAVYLSPITTPQPGSADGYSVIDHNRINPELGGEQGFANLARALKQTGLGAVLDIVPNHMSIANGKNPWWQDLLKHGNSSPYADYFDLFWEESSPPGKINLFWLGAPLIEVIEARQLKIRADATGGFSLTVYGNTDYPINQQGEDKIRAATIDLDLAALNDDTNFLLMIHNLQYYQLNYWRQIGSINYSRFFAIESLARLRVEEQKVFDAAHQGVLRWTQELADMGIPVAWRIDHPDGLVDPEVYFQRVQQALTAVVGPGTLIIAEKILGDDETLPSEWYEHGVMGTVGYDFMKQANDLAISPAGLAQLQDVYQRCTGERGDEFETIQTAASAVVLESKFDLQPEFERCARFLVAAIDVTDDERRQRLRRALFEVLIRFPIYRTYINDAGKVSDTDRCYINDAFDRTKQAHQSLGAELDSIENLMLSASLRPEIRSFVRYFQRISGPVKAKGLEDTALYRHVVAGSLHEVGGNPAQLITVPEFHTAMTQRAQEFPYSFTSLSTHDTKRGLDTRMRAAALTYLAADWESWLSENVAANARYASADVELHRADLWLLYQTIVTALPPEWLDNFPSPDRIDNYAGRIEDYLMKSLREAKERTYWVKPEGTAGEDCQAYEDAIVKYLRSMLADPTFVTRLTEFSTQVVALAIRLGLGQVALAATAPGTVEIYQGGFDWNTTLVDPDNRQLVDHAKSVEIKTAMMITLLKERNLNPSAFVGGTYEPIDLAGVSPDAAISYRRSSDTAGYIIAISLDPNANIADVTLTGLSPDRAYVDIFTNIKIHSDNKGILGFDRLLENTLPLTVLRECPL
jgi:(1->4)-alpha-D-glucan 1-alpha-D-glucosylmutase